jgi:hypothetical protein
MSKKSSDPLLSRITPAELINKELGGLGYRYQARYYFKLYFPLASDKEIKYHPKELNVKWVPPGTKYRIIKHFQENPHKDIDDYPDEIFILPLLSIPTKKEIAECNVTQEQIMPKIEPIFKKGDRVRGIYNSGIFKRAVGTVIDIINIKESDYGFDSDDSDDYVLEYKYKIEFNAHFYDNGEYEILDEPIDAELSEFDIELCDDRRLRKSFDYSIVRR